MSPKTDLNQKGAAQAALFSVALGVLTLALVNLGTEFSESFKATVHQIGKLWMPGAQGIGPYSGKETLSLLVWLASWFLLHRVLRQREWNPPLVTSLFLAGIAVATTLLWPPVTHEVVHILKGG